MNANIPDISIIIITRNSASHLPHCLDCLRVQTFKNFEIVVVDNGSNDGSVDLLDSQYLNLNLKTTQLEKNLGFAAANNIGARLARGEWLILLNADAFPEPNWLENLIAASKAHPKFASFSSRQIQANDPELLDGAGDAYHISGLAWRRYIGYPAKNYGQESVELFSPCAAAAMYLRKAFLDVDGFDEDFFSYFEDVDLGFRLQLRGYRCLYVPDAVVYHIGSATFGRRSDFSFYHSHRNLIWTFIKNMPSTLLWRYLPMHFLANLIYIVYYTLQGRGKVLWQAKCDALKELPNNIRKRHVIQANIHISPSAISKVMEHGLFQPYLLESKRRQAISMKNIPGKGN